MAWSDEEDIDENVEQLHYACRSGDEEHAMRYARILTDQNYIQWDKTSAFNIACGAGKLGLAQKLSAHFKLTEGNIREGCNPSFEYSCTNGHLEVAQWLTEHFNLTPDDAHLRNDSVLRHACRNGHLDVAQWLVDQFKLTSLYISEYAYLLDFTGTGLGPKCASFTGAANQN